MGTPIWQSINKYSSHNPITIPLIIVKPYKSNIDDDDDDDDDFRGYPSPMGSPPRTQVPLERATLRGRGRGLRPVAPAQCDAPGGSAIRRGEKSGNMNHSDDDDYYYYYC